MNSVSSNNGSWHRTRVKICGITRIADALAAANTGADAVGLVFAVSPRQIGIAPAAEIARALPAFVARVGLFVDAPAADVRRVLGEVPLDVLQFHGDESPEYCAQFGRTYIKALRMRDDIDLALEARRYASAQALLLDTYLPGVAGGTGQVFDWSRLPASMPKAIILAGGLTPANVAAAIAQVRPWAVDTSGGVELEKGIKSADKISKFISGVSDGDSHRRAQL